MNRLHLPLLAFAVALFATSCGDGRQPLTIYSPHGSDLLALVEKAYEAKHPEIDVRWLDMGSQEVYDRIRSEAANPQADVWYGGPQTIFIRGAEDGLLTPYRRPAATRGTSSSAPIARRRSWYSTPRR